MSSEKRRRARIQGGWASSSKSTPKPSPRPSSVRSDKDKPVMSSPPDWVLANNCSDPSKEQKFVFQEPLEKVREKPKERVIQESGVYDISESINGVSRLRLINNWLEDHMKENLYECLSQEIPWRQRSDMKEGVEYLQPRLTAWYGDHPYSYSGVTHDLQKTWHPMLNGIKEQLEESTGLRFNSVLCNLYRDGHEHVPWHADDEESLGPNPTIASVSLGDTRNFELRKKLPKGTAIEEYDYVEHIRIPVESGSLLIMEGAVQEDWQHRIKREYHDRGPRINLTYRVILPKV